MLLSRPLIEYVVRERLEGRVTGVGLGNELLMADLVVDLSGRGWDASDWLDSMGYERPEIERVEIGVGYTTRLFRRRPQDSDGEVAVVAPANRESTKAVLCWRKRATAGL